MRGVARSPPVLFLSATAWVVVILFITGIVLSSVYRGRGPSAFDRRLNLYLRTIIAELATKLRTPRPPHQFQCSANRLFECSYLVVLQIPRTDSEKHERRASRSAVADKKAAEARRHGGRLTAAGIRRGYIDGPEGQTCGWLERRSDPGADGKFSFGQRAGDASEIFDGNPPLRFITYGGTRGVVDRAGADHDLQVRFGLAPLKRI